MIILENNTYQTFNLYPDTDWTGSAKYIVDDSSDLAQKVMDCQYGFITIEDRKGNLVDVIPKLKPLEEVKQDKINEIVATSIATSVAGVDYTYNGTTSHYSLSTFDVACIATCAQESQQGLLTSWHADDGKCRLYTPEEFLGLYATSKLFMTHHQTYSNCLKHQVEEMTNIEEIKSVQYGITQLNDEYQAEYDIVMNNTKKNLGLPVEGADTIE